MELSSIRSNGLMRFTEVLNDPSFFDALEKTNLESVLGGHEAKYEESYFDIDAKELQTFLTVCSQAISLQLKPMLQYFADYGFSFQPQCLEGNSSNDIIRNIISKCKAAALEYQRSSLKQVEKYAQSHEITERSQFQELYDKEKLFAFVLFDDEEQQGVIYNLLDAFKPETPQEDLIKAVRDFAVAFPETIISVVFRVQFPQQFEQGEGEQSDEGDEV